MNFQKDYTVDFTSDGTNSMTFSVDDPPLNIIGTPTAIQNVDYRADTTVPAGPYIQEATLSGKDVTVTWSGKLPQKNISLQTPVYTLFFTLVF